MATIRVGGGGSILVVLEGFTPYKGTLPTYAQKEDAQVFVADHTNKVKDMGGTPIFVDKPGNKPDLERHLHFDVT